MTNYKVLIADGLESAGIDILKETAEVLDRTGIAAAELPGILGDVDAMVVRSRTKVTADVLDAAPELKVIGRAGIGVDTIDLEAAKARNVIVVNTPVATTTAVAELAMTFILGLARRVSWADAQMKQGKWAKNELVGVELAGSTLGIIGVGKIGFGLARRAASFHIKIVGFDVATPPEDMLAAGIEPVSLDEVFRRSDFISLHVPLNQKTKGLIDRDALAAMKPGVRIISTSRGGVVEEKPLLDALNSGHVAGAALDVFEQEPPGLTELVAHPNVIATPHIGAQTAEAQARAAVDVATEIVNVLEGKPLRWRVA